MSISSSHLYFGAVTCVIGGIGYAIRELSVYAYNQKVKLAFERYLQKNQKRDAYENCTIDLTRSDVPKIPSDMAVCENIFTEMVISEKLKPKKHVIVVKLNTSKSSLYHPLLKAGFLWHSATNREAVLKQCLSGHSTIKCPYPKYRPISIGVTIVVFNSTLDKVLLVQEKTKPLIWKPPTGIVEYDELDESPVKAAARELEEETGITVQPKDFKITSVYFAYNYSIPDLHIACACTIEDDACITLNPQESEINDVAWYNVALSLKEGSCVPALMQKTIEAAHSAFKKEVYWRPQICMTMSNKPVTLYSNLVRVHGVRGGS